MTEQYKWFNRNGVTFQLSLFFPNETKGKLPLLNKQDNMAMHQLEISVFAPIPYKRPYKKEYLSEDEETITFKKKFLSKYKGDINASIYLKDLGMRDSEPRAIAFFLNGGFKEAQFGNPASPNVITTQEAFKKELTDYFKSKPGFGQHLPELIKNSNLPQTHKDAVKSFL